MSELHGPDTGDHVFNWPSLPQDIKQLKAGRTHMDTISNGVGGSGVIKLDEKVRIKKIGMIC